jgi:hypothetical protein
MSGERGEAHRDRLAVADVGEHLIEDRQRGERGRGAQPGLVQERSQPERLQRHCLPTGVRAAQDDSAQPAELQVDRHGGRAVEERMPRSHEPHLLADLDRRAAEAG